MTDQPRRPRKPHKYPWAPWSQPAIDLVRCKVMWTIISQAVAKNREHTVGGVKHLWFPEANVENRLLRDGNPPADVDRPKHLRGMNLVIDLNEIPPHVWDSARAKLREHMRGKYRLVTTATEALIKPVRDDDQLVLLPHQLARN